MRAFICLILFLFQVQLSSHAQINEDSLVLKFKGSLCYPIKHVKRIVNYTPKGTILEGHPFKRLIFISDRSESVFSLFDGEVSLVYRVENRYIASIDIGSYDFTYVSSSKPLVNKGDHVKAGDIVFQLSKDQYGYWVELEVVYKTRQRVDLFPWFKKKSCP